MSGQGQGANSAVRGGQRPLWARPNGRFGQSMGGQPNGGSGETPMWGQEQPMMGRGGGFGGGGMGGGGASSPMPGMPGNLHAPPMNIAPPTGGMTTMQGGGQGGGLMDQIGRSQGQGPQMPHGDPSMTNPMGGSLMTQIGVHGGQPNMPMQGGQMKPVGNMMGRNQQNMMGRRAGGMMPNNGMIRR